MPGTENNFPSKILDYLAWRKPIISTWTKGLSPEYREVLHITEDNPLAFSSAMTSYIGIEQEDTNKHEKWFKEKTWKKQAISLLIFLEKIWCFPDILSNRLLPYKPPHYIPAPNVTNKVRLASSSLAVKKKKKP